MYLITQDWMDMYNEIHAILLPINIYSVAHGSKNQLSGLTTDLFSW